MTKRNLVILWPVLAATALCLLSCVPNFPPFVWESSTDERIMAGDTMHVKAYSNDPEGDSVAMRFAWGDGDTSEWSSYTALGCSLKVTHVYADGGLFPIRIQGKDRHNRVSDWDGVLEASVVDSSLVKWFVKIGYGIYSCPAIADDGTVYVDVGDGLCAINPDGSTKWKAIGDYGTPVVAPDGTIYLNGNRTLKALTPQGELHWYNALPAEGYPPAVGDDGTIYMAAGDSLFALSPTDSLLWACRFSEGVSSSPVITPDGSVCVVVGSNSVRALSPVGIARWTWTAMQTEYLRSELAVDADGSVYAYSDHDVFALDEGAERWQYHGDVASAPVVGPDGTLYVGGSSDSGLIALNPDGTEQWKLSTGRAYTDWGQGLAVDAEGVIYHAGERDSVYAVNPDGSVKYAFNTGSIAVGHPAIAPDGTVYVGSGDDYLYALKGAAPLAAGQWPKSRCDARNSGQAVASAGLARRTK